MKYLLTFILLMCTYALCGAQATSLTVDNQTPGWLSSKINYGDQMTVENLTITGYINGTDFNFIQDLSNRRSLHGVLDLSKARIVAGGEMVNKYNVCDDTWSVSLCQPKKPFRKVILPMILKNRGSEYSDCSAYADTVLVPTPFDDSLELYTNKSAKWRFYSIPEGVKTLNYISYNKVVLPTTCSKINGHTQDAILYAPWENPSVDALYSVYVSTGSQYYYPSGIIYVPNGSKELYMTSDFKEMEIREYGDIEIHFDTATRYVYANDTIQLKYDIKGWQDEIGWIDVKSDNEGFDVNIDEKYIIFENAGQYEITLMPRSIVPLFNMIGGKCMFKVWEHATSVEIPKSLTIGIGDSIQLSATVQPEGMTNNKVTWLTTDFSVASVNNDGIVTAKKNGTCKIIATSVDGGHEAVCDVTVVQPVESVTISSKDVSLKVGESKQLSANVLPQNAYDKTVIWESSDISIATVSEYGKILGKAPGCAKIYGISNYNHEIKDSCEITVIQPVTGIQLANNELELEEDESIQIQASVLPAHATNKDVNWTSSDVSVAMVSPDGTVYAIKPGQATIMATTVDGGFVALCKIKVKAKEVIATSIQIIPTSRTIAIGETIQLDALLEPENVTNANLSWASSNPNIATVDASGLVRAVAEGSTRIIATTTDGSNLSAICEISVEKQFIEITKIQISSSSERIPVGQSVKLNAIITPDDATSPNVLWSSTNTSIATVSQDGYVEGVAEGEAIIIASTQDGSNLSATCSISVYNDIILISEIILNPVNIEGDENESTTINAVIIPENATNKHLRWHSSNENVAVVNEGIVKLVKKGTAIITAEALDGSNVKSECTVVVSESAGIESIIEDKNTFVKIFNLSGHLVYQGLFADANIEPGIYIVLCNGKSIKTNIE